MTELRIHLFGKCLARRDEKSLPNLVGSKVQELFCYLLLHRERPHSRDGLATLLWADCPAAGAKKYLRQALWQLQSAVGSETTADDEALLELETEWLGINPRAELWVDVEELERAFLMTRDTPGRQLAAQQAKVLEQAVALYTGDLLESCYDDWCLFERERLRNQYLALLDKLTDYCEEHGKYEAGLIHGMKILNLDQARECTHRRLMRLHYLRGDRTAALRQFERCSHALDKELDVEPAEETLVLFRQIRQDRLDRQEVATGSGPARSEANFPAGLPAAVDNLIKLRRDLEQLLDRVRQEMLSMESLVKYPKKIEIETLERRSKDARKIAA